MSVITLRLPDDVENKLRAMAADERRSVNAQATVLIERALSDAERERQP